MSRETRQYWDGQAAAFDDEADHGLRDSSVRQAWGALLLRPLRHDRGPRLRDWHSLLLAEAGHDVHGIDQSSRMIDAACTEAAAARLSARFSVADATAPPVKAGPMDIVLVRHVLWIFEEPGDVIGTPSGCWPPAAAAAGRGALVNRGRLDHG